MKYGLGETSKNIIAVVYTRLFWKNARLIRLPIYARNKGNIYYEKGLTTGYFARLNAGKTGKIMFGYNVVIGDFVQIEGQHLVRIGNNVLMGSRIFISDNNHGEYKGNNPSLPESVPNKREVICKAVEIGDNVWIGNGAAILAGVVIGKGSIIGANSVVTSNIPECSLAAGVPARVIKTYNKEEQRWERKACNT